MATSKPFTAAEKERFEKLDATFHRIICDRSTEPHLIQELLEQAAFLYHYGSIRLQELQRDFKHYLTLNQKAAKESLWKKMLVTISGLQTEVANSKSLMQRGGSGVQ